MANEKKTGLTAPDITAFLLIMAFFAAFLFIGRFWTAPLQANIQPEFNFSSLPTATLLSISRILIAYLVCLFSSLAVGYWAAHSRLAEKILIPLIDIGQSIPVLGFLPGFVVTLLALFPNNRIGLELAAILTLYTGMAWNLMLSFYGSIKTIPREYTEIVKAYGYGRLGTFVRLELPYATNGIVWNSMLSVAGGWFFITVCESYTLGDRSFQLLGLGSFMSQAAERGNYGAIALGISLMVAILLLTDYFIWRPLLRWSEHFQRNPILEEEEESELIVSFFTKSQMLSNFFRKLRRKFASRLFVVSRRLDRSRKKRWQAKYIWLLLGALFIFIAAFSFYAAWEMIASVTAEEWLIIAKNTGWSSLRVFFTLCICVTLMVPLGLFIGSQPALTRRIQPMIQVIAAFPAPMIFPLLISVFLWLNIPISVGAVVLMMTGAQWYLLFNTISGAATVPPSMAEVAKASGMSGVQILWRVYLPAAFPQILTGLITAAGGAWNTSIVAELVTFHGKEYVADGLGSYIARAASNANFAALFAAVVVMVLVIVLLNRFVWAYLYNLAESRYRLDA